MAGLISDFIEKMEIVIVGMSTAFGYRADWSLAESPDPTVINTLLQNGQRCAYLEVVEETPENEEIYRAQYPTMSVYENTISVKVNVFARQTYPDAMGKTRYQYNSVVSEVIEDLKKGFGQDNLNLAGAQWVTYDGATPTSQNDVTQSARIEVRFKIRYYQRRNEPETIVT